MKWLIDNTLFGASLGTTVCCLIGVAILPLFTFNFWLCVVGVAVGAAITQEEGKRLFGGKR